jgi:nucleotide-binding universal stress UspA family protein
MYQRILVATDGSELSQKTVSSAIALAGVCGAELVAVTVIPYYTQNYFEGGNVIAAIDAESIEKQWEASAQSIVDAVKQAAREKGVQALALVVKSDAVSDALLETAAQQKCDLIVMASHGRRGIARLLLGSETQHVLTHSTIAVLVLK